MGTSFKFFGKFAKSSVNFTTITKLVVSILFFITLLLFFAWPPNFTNSAMVSSVFKTLIFVPLTPTFSTWPHQLLISGTISSMIRDTFSPITPNRMFVGIAGGGISCCRCCCFCCCCVFVVVVFLFKCCCCWFFNWLAYILWPEIKSFVSIRTKGIFFALNKRKMCRKISSAGESQMFFVDSADFSANFWLEVVTRLTLIFGVWGVWWYGPWETLDSFICCWRNERGEEKGMGQSHRGVWWAIWIVKWMQWT